MPSTEIRLGGMHPIGDAAKMPQGKSRLARNVMVRPGGEIVGRPALRQDAPAGKTGTDWYGKLGVYFDEQAHDSKLVFVDSGGKFFTRTSAGTWTQYGTGDELSDWTNHLGEFVFTGEDGVVRKFDGENDVDYYFEYPYTYVKAAVCESFINRLFLGDITQVIENELYDATYSKHLGYFETGSGWDWEFINAKLDTTTNGSTILQKIAPTVNSGYASAFLNGSNYSGAGEVTRAIFPAPSEPKATWRIDIRNRSENYVPLTFEIIHSQLRASSGTAVLGDIVTPWTLGTEFTSAYSETGAPAAGLAVTSTSGWPGNGTVLVPETGEIIQYQGIDATHIGTTSLVRGAGNTTAKPIEVDFNVTTSHGRAYLCTTAGTTNSLATAPMWDPVIGNTTSEATYGTGTAVWKCIGSDVLGSLEVELLKASEVTENDGWVSYSVKGTMTELGTADANARAGFGVRIRWGNKGASEWPLTPIEVAWRDGVTDGDPEKRNRGQQLTFGHLDLEFFNAETTNSNTIRFPRRIMWTETDFTEIRANSYWDMDGVDSPVSALKAIENRLHVFTGDSLWVFQGTADPNFPLQRAASYKGVGCQGPGSILQVDGTLFFLDDSSLYASGGGRPEEVIDDGMRRHLFPLETGSCLGIDRLNNELWISKGNTTKRAYVLNLDTKEWSYCDVKTSAGTDVETMTAFEYWDDKLWVVTGSDIVRKTDTTQFRDNSNSTDQSVLKMYVLPNIDAAAPKQEFLLREVELRHRITKSGQEISVYLSKDRWKTSKTGEKYVTVTIDELAEIEKYGDGTFAASLEPTTESVKLPFWQGRIEDLPILIIHDGDTGETAFRLSGIVYHLDTQGEHIQSPVPTIAGSSL